MRLSEKELNLILKHGYAKVRDPVRLPSPNMERNIINEIDKPYANQAFDSPVIITVHSFRYRLADSDGLCAKYSIDAIVKSGLLVDDSPKEVQEVRFKQTKIKKPEEEKTIITIEEVKT